MHGMINTQECSILCFRQYKKLHSCKTKNETQKQNDKNERREKMFRANFPSFFIVSLFVLREFWDCSGELL